jgi:hypothetical protein
MRFTSVFALGILSIFSSVSYISSVPSDSVNTTCERNNCITFIVASGTGCNWMCNYCANQLGTNNYYFTDGVCSYQSGGCVGSPQSGKQYSCCSV